MWLEWILDEGSRLFSDVSLWMRELLFLDEKLEEDVFAESIFGGEDVTKTMVDAISFPIQMSEAEETNVLQKSIWQEMAEDMPISKKENIILEEVEQRATMQENEGSIWQMYGTYNGENLTEHTEQSVVWAEGFSETNWLDGGKEEVPQKSVVLQEMELEQKQIEGKSEAEVKEENRRNTANETKIVENTSAEFDINLLMETFEKKLWAARQKGGSRLIQR